MVTVNKESDKAWGVDKFDRFWYRPGLEGKDGYNWAQFGTASQPSETWGGKAERAIDGNTSGNWHDGSITHTANEIGWWKVDLASEIIINKVVIWNRYDCCHWRLGGVNVELLDAEGEVITYQSID